MNLLPQLVVRLFAITAACLVAAIAWIVFDAHRSVEREAELSAARVGQHLEGLYWQEQLWRGRGRTGLNTPAPEWQSFATLNLIAPGVCVTFALRGESPQTLCSQTAALGPTAPGWFVQRLRRAVPRRHLVERPLFRARSRRRLHRQHARPRRGHPPGLAPDLVVAAIAAGMAAAIATLAALMIGRTLAAGSRHRRWPAASAAG
jgi:two-component system sensor histidine kinase UhpB